MRIVRTSWSSILVSVAVGCGGAAPPPEQPAPREEPPPAAPAAASTSSAEADKAEADEAEVEAPPSAGAEAPASAEPPPAPAPSHGMKPSRPPSLILTAPKVAFMINYPASAPKKAAEEKCDEEFGDDLEGRAKCMGEARKEFIADVMLFKKEGDGPVWWIIYRRDRGNLFELSKSQVEFKDEKETTVTVRLLGKGSGARPLFNGAQSLVVTVPNDSSLELTDPKLGQLAYEAKIGLVGN